MTSPAARYPRPFGRYILASELARGGMGELHLALSTQTQTRKAFVVKQLLAGLHNGAFVSRFIDEVRLASRLTHGNLVPVFEGGIYEDRYYLVMEYIEGRDLRSVNDALAEQGRRFPLPVALHIIKELCRALSYIHTFEQLGLVHRDVNPRNVMLSYAGEVRLTDFGLTKGRNDVLSTSPHLLWGKLSHMSPEQACKQPLDCRADIYSVGMMLWELLTGQGPLPSASAYLERLAWVRHPHIPRPSTLVPDLPPELDQITERALALQPQDRYASAEELRVDLALLLARLDPRTDAQHVSQLLAQLYGESIETHRRTREQALAAALASLGNTRQTTETTPVMPSAAAATSPAANTAPCGEAAAPQPTLQHPMASPEAPTPRLRPGAMLGERYRIEGLLGEGGMGAVYKATHLDLDKRVAVKVLHALYQWMPDAVQRFRREARAASRIGHPHIIEIYDAGTTEDGSIYFAMEHLDGQDLADLLNAEAPLAIDRALSIAMQIADAVGAAHDAGIVHRDLKPENIFLAAKERNIDFVKVLDFGIAQVNQPHPPETEPDRFTRPGVAMGTPQYMAPEQARGQLCDHRADIYAVGAMLYEMIAGDAPHGGDDALQVLSRKSLEPARPLREIRPEVTPELERVINAALAVNPADRPKTMSHWLYELNKLKRGRADAVANMLGLSPQRHQARTGSSSPQNSSISGEYGAMHTPWPPLAKGPAAATQPAPTHQPTPPPDKKHAGKALHRSLLPALLIGAGLALLLIIWRYSTSPVAPPAAPRADTLPHGQRAVAPSPRPLPARHNHR